MKYSIRMRAAQGGPHENGGRHISGAERILAKDELAGTAGELVSRALHHSKGEADFIRITVDAIPPESIRYIPCLRIDGTRSQTPAETHETAIRVLGTQGVTEKAVRVALHTLLSRQTTMRGAMVVDCETGERLDTLQDRGIRVSRMGFDDPRDASVKLAAAGYTGDHINEALVLAAKVLSAPGVVGELCISDDPDYVTGYVSYGNTYHRLAPTKELGNPFGGRIFFVKPGTDLKALRDYLEEQTVLVESPIETVLAESPATSHVDKPELATVTGENAGNNVAQSIAATAGANNATSSAVSDSTVQSPLTQELQQELDDLTSRAVRRSLTTYTPVNGARAKANGRTYLMMTTNNYLGLAQAQSLRDAAIEAVKTYGTGSGGARLLSGSFPLFQKLEEALARLKETEAALVFNTGYMTNVGVVSALVGAGDHVISDELNHASIIDGCRLSRAKIHVYKHNDIASLIEVMNALPQTGRRLIITDGVFSMDGDIAPLPELLDVAHQYNAWLAVDDAHATGVIGDGRGTAHHYGINSDPSLIQIGTLSKAVGSEGGFVCASRVVIDYLMNKARSFIFSTALSPADIGAAYEAIMEIIDGVAPVKRLQQAVEVMTNELAEAGVIIPGKTEAVNGEDAGTGGTSEISGVTNVQKARVFDPTPIFPIIVGSAERAVKVANAMKEHGVILSAVRPPTVAVGESRLRLTVTADHSNEDIRYVAETLKTVLNEIQ